MANYLSLTVIFQGGNLNYSESTSSIMSLKRLTFKGKSFSYISRQSLRYDIVRIMHEEYNIPLTPPGSDGKVVQFDGDAKIDQYPEIDLFGYMKTSGEGTKGKIRKAVVRLSDAISLEPWNNDIDYANNMGLSHRKEGLENMIFQAEIHKSFYTYTITIDLDNVGKDVNDKIDLSNKDKLDRIILLLDTIKILYRDIKGRREDLSPLFVIGGVYKSGNPFFYNKISLTYVRDSIQIVPEPINDTLEKTYLKNLKVKDSTYLGYVDGIFENINEIDLEENRRLNINEFFEKIKEDVKSAYQGSK